MHNNSLLIIYIFCHQVFVDMCTLFGCCVEVYLPNYSGAVYVTVDDDILLFICIYGVTFNSDIKFIIKKGDNQYYWLYLEFRVIIHGSVCL